MVRRFINASKIEIYKKNPTAAAHDGRSIHTAVACGVTWGPRCRLALSSYRYGPRRQGPNAVAHGGKTYGPTASGSPRRYVPDAHGPRRQMYSFAKFRADHIFLRNRDRKNIKNSIQLTGMRDHCSDLVTVQQRRPRSPVVPALFPATKVLSAGSPRVEVASDPEGDRDIAFQLPRYRRSRCIVCTPSILIKHVV
jgi:hypothetical protein